MAVIPLEDQAVVVADSTWAAMQGADALNLVTTGGNKNLSDDINGVLLMNIGTPSAPTTTGIRSFLKEFLSDPDVIDTNPVLRWLIVNCIVAPFRPRKVLPQYQSIWTEDGSPLLVNSEQFKVALQNKTPDIRFELGMRYGDPSIESGINKLLDAGVTNLLLCPMFPQYAQATLSLIHISEPTRPY